jgi:PAS domain S-box-containing protein
MSPVDIPLDLLWLALGSALVGGVVVLVLTRLLARREGGAAVREIVRAIEDLTEGRLDRLPPVEADEPLAPVAAALASVAESLRRGTAERERHAAFLRSLLDRAKQVAFIGTDPAGDVTFWSDGARDLLGYTSEEVWGRQIARLFTEESWELLLPRVSRRDARDGAETSTRARMLRRGGGEVPVFVSVSAGADAAGRGLFYTVRDATQVVALERQLHESEEKHRRLTDGLSEGAFVLQRGEFVYANRTMEKLAGASEEGLKGRAFRDLIASEDLLRVMALVSEVSGGTVPGSCEARMGPPGGGATVEVRMSLAPGQMSGHPAVIGSVAEIGASKRAWRDVRASELKLDATLEATSDAILMLSGSPGREKVSVANRQLQAVLGIEPRELFQLMGREIARRISRGLKDGERFDAFFQEALTTPDRSRCELFETRPVPGKVLEVFSAPAKGPDGRVMGRVFSFRDVTGRQDMARSKQALENTNAEIETANEMLRRKSADLDRINRELRSLDQMKSELLANVSHELQTPLVSIKGYTEMILKGKLGSVTAEQRRGLEISLRNIDRLIGMIDNLLALARTEKEMPAMEVTVYPLWELIEECVELVRERADKRGIILTTRYLTEDLMVKGDRAKIAQVFLNLLSNAIKFNREKGEVSLSVRRGKRGYLIVEIRDTGIGIPAESLDRIFDRLYRVPVADASAQQGSGLGLSIVKDILRLHGCVVKADSRPGEGSVFTFTLPMASGSPDDQEHLPGGGLENHGHSLETGPGRQDKDHAERA